MVTEGAAPSHSVKRIAVLAYHSSPLVEPGEGDAGGMTVYVRAVAAAHAARGVEVDIFTRATSPVDPIRPLAPGVRVISIPAGPARAVGKETLPAHIGEFVAGIAAFADRRDRGYDLVHTHYWQSGVAGLQLSAAWNVPLVHSQHTLARVKNLYLPPGEAPEPQSRIDGERLVIGGADVLIASSEEEGRHLMRLYDASRDRLKSVHPGVDHSRFAPGGQRRARRRLGLAPREPVVLCIGRIQPLKGLDVALRSIARLRPLLARDPTLVVVGGPSGPSGDRELARLRRLTGELGLSGRVRFEGSRPHQVLPDYYRAADALLVSSHSESFGLAALEAHACGLPVVATAVGGVTFVVRDGVSGWVVPQGDPDVFALRLQPLLSDDALRRSFSLAALESAGRFSWERTAEELLELYDCLIETRVPELCTCGGPPDSAGGVA